MPIGRRVEPPTNAWKDLLTARQISLRMEDPDEVGLIIHLAKSMTVAGMEIKDGDGNDIFKTGGSFSTPELRPKLMQGIRYTNMYPSLKQLFDDQKWGTYGGMVFQPTGTYYLGTTHHVPHHTSIIGANMRFSRWIWNDAGGSLGTLGSYSSGGTTYCSSGLKIDRDPSLVSSVLIRDLQLEAKTAKRGHAIQLISSSEHKYEHLYINKWGGFGIFVNGDPYSCIIGDIYGCQITTTSHALDFRQDTRGWGVIRNYLLSVNGNYSPTPAYGIIVRMSSGYCCNFYSNITESGYGGYWVAGCRSVVIDGNYWESVTGYASQAGNITTGFRVTDGYMYGCGPHIFDAGVWGGEIRGLFAQGGDGALIVLKGTVPSCKIWGNYGADLDAPANNRGISIGSITRNPAGWPLYVEKTYGGVGGANGPQQIAGLNYQSNYGVQRGAMFRLTSMTAAGTPSDNFLGSFAGLMAFNPVTKKLWMRLSGSYGSASAWIAAGLS